MTINSLLKLKEYCEQEEFKGWDPYDGLNSKIFQKTPLKNWDIPRLLLIQLFKRSPINFRKLFLVPKGYNAKGIALLLSGYCNLYELSKKSNDCFGSSKELKLKINKLSELLVSLESKGYSGSCWGYNFGWQARRLFYFPANTPTVVATSFCVEALLHAYKITKNNLYLEKAISSAKFILNDLIKYKCKNGFLLSYSPIKGNDTVFNASLLGAKLLIQIYQYTDNEKYKDVSQEIIDTVCEFQNKDGSWVYGLNPIQTWKDSFHTGYNLISIQEYKSITNENIFNENINKGFEFYINSFFTKNGMPKYYNNKMYPIDIHCPGQLLVTLVKLNMMQEYKSLAEKTLNWTINNMQDKSGYFYYQKKKYFSSKISYMRWSNAFMFNAMSCYLSYNNN